MKGYINEVPPIYGYFWYKTLNVEPCVMEVTPNPDEENPDWRILIRFTGDDQSLYPYELADQYEVVGPIALPEGWEA